MLNITYLILLTSLKITAVLHPPNPEAVLINVESGFFVVVLTTFKGCETPNSSKPKDL